MHGELGRRKFVDNADKSSLSVCPLIIPCLMAYVQTTSKASVSLMEASPHFSGSTRHACQGNVFRQETASVSRNQTLNQPEEPDNPQTSSALFSTTMVGSPPSP